MGEEVTKVQLDHYCESGRCWYCYEEMRKRPSYVMGTEAQNLYEMARKMTESPIIVEMFRKVLEK